MDPDPASSNSNWIFYVIFFALLLLSGFFAGSESAFSVMNRIRIKSEAEEGKKRAKAALFIVNHFDQAISTLLIGSNLANIGASTVATLLAVRIAGNASNQELVTLICTVVTTVLVFLIAEMIPKSLANDRGDTVSKAAAPVVRVFMRLFSPVTRLFSRLSDLFDRLFKTKEQPSITEEELYEIAQTAEEEGVMDEEQSDLFKSALEFGDTRAGDIMTVRADIQAIDVSWSNEDILALVNQNSFSRLPVYRGTPDQMLGLLPIKTFLRSYLKDKHCDIRKMLLPPFYVREDAFIHDCLPLMKNHKFTVAFVLDEDNTLTGLLTIEDMVEELVGEIWDESDEVDPNFMKTGGNHFLVNPALSLEEVCRRMGTECPDPLEGGESVRSWLVRRLGRTPEEEDVVKTPAFDVEVTEVRDGRVTEIDFHLLDEEERQERRAEMSGSDSGSDAKEAER